MNEITLFDYASLPINDAMELNAIKERIKVRLKRTAEDIIEIGKDLIIAKEKCGHGGFEKWLKTEFEMTDRTARSFISVAERFSDKSETISVLNATALYALSAPSTPETVREVVIEKLENGEKIDLKEIERLKREIIEAKEQVKQTAMQSALKLDAKQGEIAELKSQNWKLENQQQQLIDAKVSEERAKLVLENQQAIAENKRIAENLKNELERLKREQDKNIKDGVKHELWKLENEIDSKRIAIEKQERQIEELKKVRESLDSEVGLLAIHKEAIKTIKADLSSLTIAFSDAFETATIPTEIESEWDAIFYAISKLKKQMSEWRDSKVVLVN